MNQQAIMKKIKKMQEEMVATQQEIENTVFYATSGGVVSVEVMGTKEIASIKIADDFEIESKEDFEMLSDMIVAACSQAYKEIEKTTKERMQKYNDMLGGFGGLI
ncbi:MAG: YbaB/EbfC family nucleoid-associated protein [Bacilli bacterium]|nr:YbaB/EbfC family nucleoid-associated protein [Bacilli bacterium]